MRADLAVGQESFSFAALAVASLRAGIVAAVVEILTVIAIQGAALGVSPLTIFQSIASGLTGAAAYGGGLSSALLGVALHLLISVVAAGVFAVVALRTPLLLRHAVLGGLAFGAICWFVMSYIVVPLSAVVYKPASNPVLILTSVLVHMVTFGLPIALVVSRRVRRGA